MSKLKIKHRVLLLSVATIVGMLVFAGFLLVEKRQISAEMESLNRLARLGPVVSALVHELQKERGASAGFIASKGQKFTKKLPEQRRLTDEKKAALASTFQAFDAAAYGSRLAGKIEAAQQAVARLDGTRGQVSKATEEIAAQIGAMQSVTEEAVAAIESVVGVMEKISEITTSIASAVEQQNAATSEISRNVQEAAQGTQEVTANIAGVSQAAAETGSAAGQVLSAAGTLSKQSDSLRGEVETFLRQIKEA